MTATVWQSPHDTAQTSARFATCHSAAVRMACTIPCEGLMSNSQTGTPGCCVLGLPAFPSSALGPVPSDGTAPQLQPTAVQCRAMGAACTTHLVRSVLDLVHAACTFLGPQCGQTMDQNGLQCGQTMDQNATVNADAMAARRMPISIAGCGLHLSHSLRARLVRAQARHRHCLHTSHKLQEKSACFL